MPPVRIICEGCRRPYLASRRDTKFHPRCRHKVRMENAKFAVPRIPQSGIVGVTFNRIRKRWEATIPGEERRKYIGSFGTKEEAIRFQSEVIKEK